MNTAWCCKDKNNVVTIVAWGGVGKTSLIAYWANTLLAKSDHGGIERYFDWSFYSQGTRTDDDTTVAAKAASADLFIKEALEFFGDADLAVSNASAWQKGSRLAQLIGQRRCLLVLDGLEPLQMASSGQLLDIGISALLRGLAAKNLGLCIVTTRQRLPDLSTWQQLTSPEWKLRPLNDEAGAALLSKLGVNGTENEKRSLSATVKGHALTLTLLGKYLRHCHRGDIRRVDRVNLQKVNEKEQGGHAFRVVASYEHWLEESNNHTEIAILRMLGLFDRPATPDCLAALLDPPITGLTDTLAPLDEDNWNKAVTHLVELGLLEERPWVPGRTYGYSLAEAEQVWSVGEINFLWELGSPKPFENPRHVYHHLSLDTHPLIREFFVKQHQESDNSTLKAAHSCLFDHLCKCVPFWPEGLDGLQALYHAVVHGCRAGRYSEARIVYRDRICRGTDGSYAFYNQTRLGAMGTDLAALSCFFISPWKQLAPEFPLDDQAWLFNQVAFSLRALGRLTEANEPMRESLERYVQEGNFNQAALESWNLNELHMALGNIDSAVRYSRKSVDFADKSGDEYYQIRSRASLGRALHGAGLVLEAREQFEKAEFIQHGYQPLYPLLFSVMGFDYCELLLAHVECAAWRMFLNHGVHLSNIDALLTTCYSVKERGEQLFEYRNASDAMITIAVEHLILGRVSLYISILQASRSDLQVATKEIDAAVQALRNTNDMVYLPLGLISRAWLRVLQEQPELARIDIDEARQIAERSAMRLFLADIHLLCARLFRDNAELDKARQLIVQCGYHRRSEELADGEGVAVAW